MLETKNQRHKFKDLSNYIVWVLEKSTYPEGYLKEIEAEIEHNSKTIIINYKLPSLYDVPNSADIQCDFKRGALKEVKMKAKEFNAHYESVLFQIALRTSYETVQAIDDDELNTVVFNGWVETTDRRTGIDFTACILSIMVSREQLKQINLEKASPKECFRYLKGAFGGKLHEHVPIKPILILDRKDRRFVDGVEVLRDLDEGVNLAEMDWEDFEYLVRELFEMMFSNEDAEVRVTRASRDGGVDAIAFDNDPIRGGKFVIQAKRYNNIVPVSAVRDLYGAVINEGANRGILVTTSYFGNDSREFAKDKPISLIDGSNVVHLLNEYGYKSHIKLRKKP